MPNIRWSFLLWLLVIGFVMARTMWTTKQRRATFEALAVALGGRMSGGWLGPLKLHFDVLGCPARLRLYSTGNKHRQRYTDLEVDVARHRHCAFKMKVYPEGLLSRFGRMLGMQDIQVGAEDFDRAFIIQGSDEQRVQSFLDAATRGELVAVSRLGQGGHVELSASGKELVLRLHGWVDEYGAARELLESGLRIAERYIVMIGPEPWRLDEVSANRPESWAAEEPGPDSAEVDVWPIHPEPRAEVAPHKAEAAPYGAADDFRCPVCKDALANEGWRCGACGASHHPECWQINDGCGACRAQVVGAG